MSLPTSITDLLDLLGRRQASFSEPMAIHLSSVGRSIFRAFSKDPPDRGEIGKAIYKIDGDTLVVVRGLNVEQERPRDFGTWPDTNVFMVTWKRK